MTPKQQRRVDELVSMLILLPESQRGAALDRAAPEPDVRAEVERALRAAPEQPSGDRPTIADAPQRPEPTGPLASVGPYRIQRVIGEGGFGVVYLAEQERPMRRRVALKVLKPGMDSAPVVARFEAERQALAVMDHACIAKVFDGGLTERGLPFFVMEYVEGEPITAFCDRLSMSVPDRLTLFSRVCDAVHHAHTKGVVHRDLKPGNILVAVDGDGVPQPKVIDFGIAKALMRPLTDKSIFTEQGMLIGTPAYMSPEQAGMDGVDIDTRSDIYSLGVVLYELLTGAPPFDPRTLRAAGFAEMLRVIREVDPPRPSARLSTMFTPGEADSEASKIAKSRRAEPRTLTGILRRDLDWVVMRCLEKDRARRYASASDLAEEIRRFMRNEPVLAGPPSARYRAGKFVRRHRAGVGAATLLVCAVALGLAGTATGMIRARSALRAEQRALAMEREATARAEAEAALASSIESFLTDDLLAAVSPTRAGPEVTVRALLDEASGSVEGRFADRPLTEAGVRAAIGRAYQALGLLEPAAPHLLAAYQSFLQQRGPADPRTISAGLQHATLLWRNDRADDALAVLAALEAPDSDAVMLHQANALKRVGRADDAAPLYTLVHERRRSKLGPADRATLSVAYDIALNEEARQRYDDAERWFSATLEAVRASLPADDPLFGEATSEFARFLSSRRNDAARAEPLYREAEEQMARTLGEGHWRLTQVRSNLGQMLRRTGRFDEGRPFLEQSLRAYSVTDTDRARRDGPVVLEWLRESLMAQGDADEALRLCEEAAAQMALTFGASDDATLRARLSVLRVALPGADSAPAELEALAIVRTLLGSSAAPVRRAGVAAALDVARSRQGRGDSSGAAATAAEFAPTAARELGEEHEVTEALRALAAP